MDKEVVHIYNVILPCHKKEWNNAICSSMDVLSQLSHAQLFITPWTAACQAPLSVGFSRQEYWSGSPFPSPVHESEKWKWSRSVVSNSQRPHGLQPTRLFRPWEFPGKSTAVGCHCLLWLIDWQSANWQLAVPPRETNLFAYGLSQVALVVKNPPFQCK